MSSIANEASSLPSRAQPAFRGQPSKAGIQEPGAFSALMDSQSEPAPAAAPKPTQKADKPAPRQDGSDQAATLEAAAAEDPAFQPDNTQASPAEGADPVEGKPEWIDPVASEAAKPAEPVDATATDTNADPAAMVAAPVVVDPNAIVVPAIPVAAAPVAAEANADAAAEPTVKPAAIDANAAPVLPVADENSQPAKKTSSKPASNAQAAAAPISDEAPDESTTEQPAQAEQPQDPQQPKHAKPEAKPEALHQHADGAHPQQATGEKPDPQPVSDLDSAASTAKASGEAPAHLAAPAPVAAHTMTAAPAAHGQTAAPVVLSQPIPINALAVELAGQARAGNSRFEIRLDPPELGRIDVRLDVDRDGNVTSRLVIERADTYDLLRRDQSTLERALQQAGLKTSDNALEFQLRDQGFANQQQQDDTSPRKTTALIADADATLSEAASGYARLLRAGRGIDIRV